MEKILAAILPIFGFSNEMACMPFGSGLINDTWKLTDEAGNAFIVQRISQNVFKDPAAIADNISFIADHLQQHHPEYFFVRPLKSKEGGTLVRNGDAAFRIFPFVKGSHTVDVVATAEQAYEAAKQFGRFTAVSKDMQLDKLSISIPHFHDLSLRYRQFESVLQNGNKERIDASEELISAIENNKNILTQYEHIKQDPGFKLRVTHHDTKISNVLLNENDKGICVIDLDTVMPGYFISDAGDMLRTYLSPVSEEEKDLSKIMIRKDIYKAIQDGYLSEMGEQLSDKEKAHFLYAGKFMIYMQAMRFLTDHLHNDIYYGCKYEGHNYVRAANQLTLLQKLLAFEQEKEH